MARHGGPGQGIGFRRHRRAVVNETKTSGSRIGRRNSKTAGGRPKSCDGLDKRRLRTRTALLGLFVVILLYAFACGGVYLSVYLIKLISKIGIGRFIALLAGVTAVTAILFLVDWESLSDTYKRVNRDLWFMFVKGAVLGFAAGICLIWITLFRLEILPFKYIWIFFVTFFVFAWLMDRKEKSHKRKRFPDVDALLKQKH